MCLIKCVLQMAHIRFSIIHKICHVKVTFTRGQNIFRTKKKKV